MENEFYKYQIRINDKKYNAYIKKGDNFVKMDTYISNKIVIATADAGLADRVKAGEE